MSIDVTSESLLSTGEARKWIEQRTGRRISPAALCRWWTKGTAAGVRLEVCRVGRNIYTSEQALGRFFNRSAQARIAADDDPNIAIASATNQPVRLAPSGAARPSARRGRTPEQRRRDLEAARARLRAAGVSI